MFDTHYMDVIDDAFSKLENLQKERESIEAEVMKLEQLIAATANMLPDELKNIAMRKMEIFQRMSRLRDIGLTEAIRKVMRQTHKEWLTVTNVRDRLTSMGFDFSSYSTNPLASISTTLRRLNPAEVDTKTIEGGVAAYRWKQPTQDERFDAIKRMALEASRASRLAAARSNLSRIPNALKEDERK